MRALVLSALLCACAPRVHVPTSAYEPDDPAAAPLGAQRSRPAPAVSGVQELSPLISEGRIDRTALLAALTDGPGELFRKVELSNSMDGERFVGWRVVQFLDRQSTIAQLDLVEGDVITAVNRAPISRPDEVMALWESLQSADELVIDYLRGQAPRQLKFLIVGGQPPSAGAPVPDRS